MLGGQLRQTFINWQTETHWSHVCCLQVNENLRKVQSDYECALRDKLYATSQLQAAEASKTEAQVELSRAQESRTAAVAELAAKEAVAAEKIRAAESAAVELRVGLLACKVLRMLASPLCCSRTSCVCVAGEDGRGKGRADDMNVAAWSGPVEAAIRQCCQGWIDLKRLMV